MRENKHILTPGWGKAGHTFTPPHLNVSSNTLAPVLQQAKPVMMKCHYWISNKHGYAMTSDTQNPGTKGNRKGKKFKYMGYSYDSGWPKKMSTGRTIFAFTLKKGSMGSDSNQLKPKGKHR